VSIDRATEVQIVRHIGAEGMAGLGWSVEIGLLLLLYSEERSLLTLRTIIP